MTLKMTITREGQKYVDRPVTVHPKRRSTLEQSIDAAFGRVLADKRPIVVRHERVYLDWVKPGPDGRLPQSNQ